MSKLDDALVNLVVNTTSEVIRMVQQPFAKNSHEGDPRVDETKDEIKALMLELIDIDYNKKLSRSYFQPSHIPKNNHRNGFRLALREIRKKVEEL
jgi:hypothetical protein